MFFTQKSVKMSKIFKVNVISKMSINVVTIPVSMKAIYESTVEFLKLLNFFVQNMVFNPKMSEDEQDI